MKLFRFDREVGKQIDRYESDFVMSRIMMTEQPAHIGCMHLDRGGKIGLHPAVVPQLLLVVSGKGFVRGEDEKVYPISAGEAVFWEKGENHETTTKTGLTAIVIESETLDPASFMTEVNPQESVR